MKRGRAWIAAFLSGLFPGLGQLYNRDLPRGLLFFGAGILLGFLPIGPLTVPIDPADPIPGLQRVLLESLPFLLLAVWSVLDAYRRADRVPPAATPR
jgi:TM2 domain-containing membrane protein YozV